MQQDVLKFVKACTTCQQVKGNQTYVNNGSTTHGAYPFQRIAIDYFGPLSTTAQGNQYVLVILDTFTKYAELYPMKTTQSMEMATTFYYNFVARQGLPTEIISDNGPPLGSEFVKEMAKFMGITLVFTPPRHPESNGIVEKFMQSLRALILSFITQDDIVSKWGTKLRLVRFAYNNMLHQATGYSPFDLVHGRVARTAQGVLKEENKPRLYRDTAETPQSSFASSLEKDLEVIFSLVYDKLSNSSHIPELHNVFKEGDLVYHFNTVISNKKKPRKLSVDWIGPMQVVMVLSRTRYDIKSLSPGSNKKFSNVHISLLKRHYA
ncbi:hypothetical protein [Parasitella parasitica]|uniref:Integrase catalytic domain-containing protein n=1 Tax=Parasitella parasitica TaxID=35722 RepID=A0A0B7MV46_9FUNG|nr:hypothetical protein [Parasitella parasitica]